MQRIAILTSGGDAPGMNAALDWMAGDVAGKTRPIDCKLLELARMLAQ